jgi:hypothetical protein
MRDVRTSDPAVFPDYGARARAWARFERDLRAWMESPEGRFAAWRAGADVLAPHGDEESAHHPG